MYVRSRYYRPSNPFISLAFIVAHKPPRHPTTFLLRSDQFFIVNWNQMDTFVLGEGNGGLVNVWCTNEAHCTKALCWAFNVVYSCKFLRLWSSRKKLLNSFFRRFVVHDLTPLKTLKTSSKTSFDVLPFEGDGVW